MVICLLQPVHHLSLLASCHNQSQNAVTPSHSSLQSSRNDLGSCRRYHPILILICSLMQTMYNLMKTYNQLRLIHNQWIRKQKKIKKNLTKALQASQAKTDTTSKNQSTIEISDSPVMPCMKAWIKSPMFTLQQEDKVCLESSVEWLNDRIINAAQIMLKSQCDNKLSGW